MDGSANCMMLSVWTAASMGENIVFLWSSFPQNTLGFAAPQVEAIEKDIWGVNKCPSCPPVNALYRDKKATLLNRNSWCSLIAAPGTKRHALVKATCIAQRYSNGTITKQ